MKNLLLIGLFLLCKPAFTQTKDQDQLIMNQTIEWLEERLTYNYYNVEDSEWWINRFTFNDGSQTITVKNIASPQIQAVTDKTYLQFNFRLENLNPYTITIQKSLKNNGRLVKGKTLRVGAFDKSISRSKNGTLSANQSFIYFSIPDFFEDSVKNYTQEIADRLSSAVLLASKIYGDDDPTTSIQRVINGRFTSDSQYWEVSKIFDQTYSFDVTDEHGNISAKYFINILNSGQQLEVTEFKKSTQTKLTILDKQPGNDLIYTKEQTKWHFKNYNEIEITLGQETHQLIRDWTYVFSHPKSR